jgi:acyl-homoserine-lactone acylase
MRMATAPRRSSDSHADEPHADTLLAHYESDDPASPHYRDGTRRYAVKAWSRSPFSEREVESSPGVLSSMLIDERNER